MYMHKFTVVLPAIALALFSGFQANAGTMNWYRDDAWAYGMMPWMSSWTGGFWMWVMGLSMLVWLMVGILLLMWIWKQLTKKK